MTGQLLKPALERILCKLKSDLLNPEVYWGGPLWEEKITGAASKCQKKDGPCWLGRQSIQLWCRGEWMQWNGLGQGWGREQSQEPGSRRECRGWWKPGGGAGEGSGGSYPAQGVELGQCSRPGCGTLQAIARRSPTKLPWGMHARCPPSPRIPRY